MERPIVGFRVDPEEGSMVARLSCGHGRHMRHTPPHVDRAWVTTEAGRASRLGMMVDCLKCDRMELPDDVVPYRTTKVFTEQSVPAGLLADHRTKAGVWARIEVLSGGLDYVAEDPAPVHQRLIPGVVGVVVPEHPHKVVMDGPVTFQVVFLAAPGESAPANPHAEGPGPG